MYCGYFEVCSLFTTCLEYGVADAFKSLADALARDRPRTKSEHMRLTPQCRSLYYNSRVLMLQNILLLCFFLVVQWFIVYFVRSASRIHCETREA